MNTAIVIGVIVVIAVIATVIVTVALARHGGRC